MAQLTEAQYAEDWLRYLANRSYNLEVDTLTAVGAATAGLVSGQFMEGAAGAKVLNVGGGVTAVLVEPVTLAEHIAGCKKLMLIRGPAVINPDECVVDDPSDLTDLAALLILSVNDGLVTWSKQTS